MSPVLGLLRTHMLENYSSTSIHGERAGVDMHHVMEMLLGNCTVIVDFSIWGQIISCLMIILILR